MTDITEILMNFRDFLRKSLTHLEKAQVFFGDESWDEFSELNFKILVTDVIYNKFEIHLKSIYGQWPAPKDKEVLIKIEPGSNILVGEVINDPTITVNYKEIILNNDLKIYFREFKYPFSDEEGIAQHLNYVAGEYQQDGKYFHIATPINSCRFYI